MFEKLPRALRRFRYENLVRATSCRLPYVQHVATCVLPAGAECRAAEAQPRTAEPPSQLRERYELAMTLSRALDPLPMAQRTAFILCEVEERSSQEAARKQPRYYQSSQAPSAPVSSQPNATCAST